MTVERGGGGEVGLKGRFATGREVEEKKRKRPG
jgi:hypothetical protein